MISAEKAVREHKVMVERIAYRMLRQLPSGVDVNDVIQSGMIGLLDAATRYDESRGASFATYAGIRIQGTIIDDLRKGDWAPRSVHRKSRAVYAAIQAIEARTGTCARGVDMPEEMGVSPEEYHAAVRDGAACGNVYSYDVLLEKELEQDLGNDDDPAIDTQRDAFREAVAAAIDLLPERDKGVVIMYYFREKNLREIGELVGVSESRVSQILTEVAAKLRRRLSPWGGEGDIL
jgi:RNA polymerase sigma factor for flagellar operon FliA